MITKWIEKELTPGAKITAGLCFLAGNNTPLKVRPSKVLNSTCSREVSIFCDLAVLSEEVWDIFFWFWKIF